MPAVNLRDTYLPTWTSQRPNTDVPPPTFGETVDAAIGVGSVSANLHQYQEDQAARGQAYEQGGHDPTYSSYDDITPEYADQMEYLRNARNPEEMTFMKSVIDRGEKQRQVLQASGALGTTAILAATIADPTSLAMALLPFGAAARGATIWKGVRAGATVAAAEVGAQEAMLHQAQPGRTALETTYAVGGAALLGGLLGGVVSGAAAKSFSRAQRMMEEELLTTPIVTSKGTLVVNDYKTALLDLKTDVAASGDEAMVKQILDWQDAGHSPQAIVRAVEDHTLPEQVILHEERPLEEAHQQELVNGYTGAVDGSVGAARVIDEHVDLVGGALPWATRGAAEVLPIGRIAKSENTETQKLGFGLMDNFFRLKSRVTGLPAASRAAAQTRIRQWTLGRMGMSRRVLLDQHAQYRKRMKAEGQPALSEFEFRKAVGDANNNKDSHVIPEVARTARAYREHLVLPLFHAAKQARLLDPFIKSLARRHAAEPWKLYREQRKALKGEIVKNYRLSHREGMKALRRATAKSLRDLDKTLAAQTAATERAYGWHLEQVHEEYATQLADRLSRLEDAPKAQRDLEKVKVREEFAPRIEKVNADMKRHVAALKALWKGKYRVKYAEMGKGVFNHRIEMINEQADELLAARLKVVDKTDKASQDIIKKDVAHQRRMALREVSKEQTAATKLSRADARRQRVILNKELREKVKELEDQFDADLNEVNAGFKDTTPAEFADAVHLAVVKDLPDEYMTPHMKEAVDKVRASFDDPDQMHSYFARVYDQKAIKQDQGKGLRDALTRYWVGEKIDPRTAASWATTAVNHIRGYGGHHLVGFDAHGGIERAAVASMQLERQLDVPYDIIKPWLQTDADHVWASYAHALGSRVELARTSAEYGTPGAWRLGSDLAAVEQRTAELVNAATDAGDIKLANRLAKRGEQELKDLQVAANRLLGTYDMPSDPTSFLMARLPQILKSTNFLSRMGGMTFSSFNDVANMIQSMGLARSWGTIMQASSAGVLKEALKLSQAELQRLGVGVDLLHPIFTHLPEEAGSAVTPYLSAASNKFSRMIGMSHWSSGMKALTGVMVINDMMTSVGRIAGRLKAGTLTKADEATLGDLAQMGLDSDAIRWIAEQPTVKHGPLTLADTNTWTNPQAVEAFQNAISKTVDSLNIVPGVGDKPNWIKGQWPGVITQFKSWMLAAHNKQLIPFLQDPNHARQFGSIAAAVGLGMVTHVIRMTAAGREEQLKKQIADPLALANAVVSNSSLTSLLSLMADTGFNAAGYPTLGGRNAPSSPWSAVLGPAAGTAEAVWGAAQGIGGKSYTASTQHKIRSVIPFNNTIYGNAIMNESVFGVPTLDLERKTAEAFNLPDSRKQQ